MSARELSRVAVCLLVVAACAHPPAGVTGRVPEKPTRERPHGPIAARPSKTSPKERFDDRKTAQEAGKEETGFEQADPALARVGVATTHVFHKPNCPLLKDVPTGDQLRYTTQWEGLDDGYRPCDVCRSAR